MDLHRQIALAIEIFEDQRKPRLRGMSAEQFTAALADQIMQRCTGKRSSGDDRLPLQVIGDLPALGIIVSLADRLAENCAQPPPAPQIAFQERLEREWIQRSHGWSVSAEYLLCRQRWAR